MEVPLRPLLSGLLGALFAHVLIRWLGREFPVEPKSHNLTWYERRYGWVETLCLVAFLSGIGFSLLLYRWYLAENDWRGLALGFLLGCGLAFGFLMSAIAFGGRSLREYNDYQDLKYGFRSLFSLYLVGPALAVSVYGTINLLLSGV